MILLLLPLVVGAAADEAKKIFVYTLPAELSLRPEHHGSAQQYSVGSVLYERVLVDSRRTDDPKAATLFFVPMDLQRYKVESFGLAAPKNHEHVCNRVAEVRAIVEPQRQQIEMFKTRSFINQTLGLRKNASLPPHFANSKTMIQGRRRLSELENVGSSLLTLKMARKRRRLLRTFAALDHVAPVARVASSLMHEWGKSCRTTYEWLRKNVQWLTIEAPYRVEFASREAHLDVTESRTVATSVLGLRSHHTVPYPAGVRLRSLGDLESLRQFQRDSNRQFLVVQVIGSHNRAGSTLRETLKLECERMGSDICGEDWQAARRELRDSAAFVVRQHHSPHLALYASGVFCIQPFGTTPTRNAVYQCLLAGGIPVLFEPFLIEALAPLFDAVDADHGRLDPPAETAARYNWAIVVPARRADEDPRGAVYEKLAAVSDDKIATLTPTLE
ncbi:hypothetical protein CTAYLR_000023 [Chrysophaeum taylorii]|uniref:Exostosin GT47 domain-containing protein n=1 Tax=Chrysophaeum taylorii TaxID=2483200 RepID=A0AAD7XNF2_9STRA|nr:hypothetical protein CTAYLR_000023 [Chrysophaeum taylorii]